PGLGSRPPSDADDAHADGARETRDLAADAPHPVDDDGRVAQLLVFLVLPLVGTLVVAIAVELPRRGEDESHQMLGDLDVIRPAVVGQYDPAVRELRQRHVLDTGRNGVVPAQVRRRIEKLSHPARVVATEGDLSIRGAAKLLLVGNLNAA